MTRGAKLKWLDVVLASLDTVWAFSRDCGDEGMVSSSVRGALEVPPPTSAGIVRNSSREHSDEGTSSPSESVGEECVVEGGAVEISACAEGLTSAYPDPLSVSMISGAPSIESRRDRMVAVALVWP